MSNFRDGETSGAPFFCTPGGYGIDLTVVKLVSAADDHNPRCRNAMEDAHVFIDDFAKDSSSSTTNAFFGVYDGHGGRKIVEFVEKYLHLNLEKEIVETKAETNVVYRKCDTNAFL